MTDDEKLARLKAALRRIVTAADGDGDHYNAGLANEVFAVLDDPDLRKLIAE